MCRYYMSDGFPLTSLGGIDIESEDSDDEDASTRSTSVATNTPGRALTARQAVLRNVVDRTHVSLSMSSYPLAKIDINM